jgi:tRNA acetyltransferase TAN1
MYDFNLLVSCPWPVTWKAKREIADTLKLLGDDHPSIISTAAKGIIGVRTKLDSREIIKGLHKLLLKDPLALQHTLKWVPTDLWIHCDMNSMKKAVMDIRDKIREGERWRMTIEKRRYTQYHEIEIIKELAELIVERVDLKNPDKILRIEIIGKCAAISVLTPNEIFSSARMPIEERVT